MSFQIEFDIRGDAADAQDAAPAVEQSLLDCALEYISAAFSAESAPGAMMKELERILDCRREEWSLLVLRRFADLLLGHAEWRRKSAAHESRWLNVCGYCLRPGFGYAGDEWRVSEAWKLWFGGTTFPKNVDCASQWKVFWRRIAAGLKSGQQAQAFDKAAKSLLNSNGANAIRENDQAGLEMWRMAAAMELVPPQRKLKLRQALVSGSGNLTEPMFWIVDRLAARVPLQSAADCVIPAAKLLPLFPEMMRRAVQSGAPKSALFALAGASRLSGIRTIDLPEKERKQAVAFLVKHNAPEKWRRMPLEIIADDDESRKAIFGEELPMGLVIE